jgi:hypothetical protein
MIRNDKVRENVLNAYSNKTRVLTPEQRKYLSRFDLSNDTVLYTRPVMFGVQIVKSYDMTIREFNKLHMIANPSSTKH